MNWDYFNELSFNCIKMEFQKIINLLNTTSGGKDLPRFVTKDWIEIYDLSAKHYPVNKDKIRFM